MWSVLPKFGVIKLLSLLISIISLSALLSAFNPSEQIDSSLFNITIKLATPVALVFLMIVYVVGKYAWRFLWGLPVLGKFLNRHVCPDLNGSWKGIAYSNFPREKPELTEKEIIMEIEADFFGFKITTISIDGYQSSKVTQSEIYRDPKTKDFIISYIYEGEVPFPNESDDRAFDGAGRLVVSFSNGHLNLTGTYWTNRAWQRNQNTAGRIELKREEKSL